jgi:hypothetical protein
MTTLNLDVEGLERPWGEHAAWGEWAKSERARGDGRPWRFRGEVHDGQFFSVLRADDDDEAVVCFRCDPVVAAATDGRLAGVGAATW